MDVAIPDDLILKERDSGHETMDTRTDLLRVRRWARDGRVSPGVHPRLGPTIADARRSSCRSGRSCVPRGVEVICIQNPIHDLDLSLAKMIHRMQGMVGEMEWEYIRRRTTENKQRLRDEGKRVGEGGPLFGYRWKLREDGKIDPSRCLGDQGG